jgi:multicomponent Na+:H+ antiporter subunit D
MSAEFALMALLGAPALQALCVMIFSRPPGLRDVVFIGFALVIAGLALFLADAVGAGASARVVLARPLPNVDLAFTLNPLGVLMAALIALLGAPHAVHAAGIVRAMHEKAPARMMAFLALSTAAAMAVAFSANLFSFFVAYQALILTSFPLVAHRGDEDARVAARVYLATLLAGAIGLLLPAMVWTYAIAGALDFQAGGVLAGLVDPLTANALLVLFVFGIGMAAAPPMHRWMTAASAAPNPVFVSTHALTVLPAGAIGVLKVAALVFGPALADARIAAQALMLLAGVAMCVTALIALSKQDIRERLSYSCLTQLLAVMMGALLASPVGLFAAALQVVALCCAAATLTMAAGAAHAATGRTNVADYAGLGRVMPWTFAGFALASASMIGLPPFSGAWAKLWLITAASHAQLPWAAALAAAAAVLTFAHLGPLAANALAGRAPTDAFKRPDGASILLAGPVILSAAATLWLLVLADPLASFLAPLWTPAS